MLILCSEKNHLSMSPEIEGHRVYCDPHDSGWAHWLSIADVLCLGLNARVASLDGAEKLKCVVTPTTGTDHVPPLPPGVELLSLAGEREFLDTVRATPELTLALLLAVARKIPAAAQHAANGGTDRDQFIGRELFGLNVAIIGRGRVGTIFGDYCKALGMHVAYLEYGGKPGVPLEKLLPWADVVSVHVPLNDETEQMIDLFWFDGMKDDAIFLNTSRGWVVNQGDLLDWLRRSNGSAGLDVMVNDGVWSANELRRLANEGRLILTPHIGGCTHTSRTRCEQFMAAKLNRWLAAQKQPIET